MSVPSPPLIQHFSIMARDYEVVLCDVWGVVHNGVEAFADACHALAQFRRAGGTVILITNAPRPGALVMTLLDRLKVPRDAYDAIVSSGDVTRSIIASRAGQAVYHIGPERDVPMFDGLAPLAPIELADYVVCSGLFDDTTESPDDYRDLVAKLLRRDLTMVCANPDVVVERGEKLVYCAGAIADLYAAAGGSVLYAGKPFRPIYEQALAAARKARGSETANARVLTIGDSVRTDLQGAANFGVDCLFVTGGIHAEELGGRDHPGTTVLGDIFASAGLSPKAVMRRLMW
jgi:HAD superfamily hydrolase (TIGR01459 family)